MIVKRMLSLIFLAVVLLNLLVGCGTTEKDYIVNYDEICDISGYREKKVNSIRVDYTSFSLDKYYNVYAVSDGLIRKYSLNNVLKDTFESTQGLNAPCWNDGYIYAYSSEGSLVRISSDTQEITVISSTLPVGFAFDLVVSGNHSFALLGIYRENNYDVHYELWQIDNDNGASQRIEIQNVNSVYASEGGCVYAIAYDADTYSNDLYSVNETEAVLIGKLPIQNEIFAFVFENGCLYYPDYNDSYYIAKFDIKTSEVETFVSNVNAFSFGAIKFRNGNIFYVDSNTQTLSSAYTVAEKQSVDNALIICDPYKSQYSESGVFNYNILSSLSGVKCNSKSSDDNVLIKIMAGDTDVDIYVFGYSTAQKLIEKGIYTSIYSDVIREFNEGCFDYINDCAYNDSGELVLVPIASDFPVMVYPQAAADELGFTKDNFEYYDSFIKLVEDTYGGQRAAFTIGSTLFFELEFQYENYYCDFKNKQVNYFTDEYKKIYSTLEGWQRYGNPLSEDILTVPKFFLSKVMNTELLKNENNVLLFNTYLSSTYDEISIYGDKDTAAFTWRAAAIPKITEEVAGNRAAVTFAFVNPYSERKEDAIKVLETLVENYYACISESLYPMIRVDSDEYPNRYYPDSELFDDFYEIAMNGAIYQTGIGGLHNDIDEYQNGRITLEEAIEMRSREVNLWLNE